MSKERVENIRMMKRETVCVENKYSSEVVGVPVSITPDQLHPASSINTSDKELISTSLGGGPGRISCIHLLLLVLFLLPLLLLISIGQAAMAGMLTTAAVSRS